MSDHHNNGNGNGNGNGKGKGTGTTIACVAETAEVKQVVVHEARDLPIAPHPAKED